MIRAQTDPGRLKNKSYDAQEKEHRYGHCTGRRSGVSPWECLWRLENQEPSPKFWFPGVGYCRGCRKGTEGRSGERKTVCMNFLCPCVWRCKHRISPLKRRRSEENETAGGGAKWESISNAAMNIQTCISTALGVDNRVSCFPVNESLSEGLHMSLLFYMYLEICCLWLQFYND